VGTVLGDLLPLTVGVAVSPVPIIAVILMLLAPRASAASVAFAVGWVLGIAAVTVLALLLSGGTDVADDQAGPSTGSSWVKLLLGLALLAVGAKQWRGRPKPGQDVALPKWMAAIDHVTPVKALAVGFALAAVNPKNLLMTVSAGVTIADGALDTGEQVVAVAVFTALAASTVVLPVLAYVVAKERMRGPLEDLRGWLQANNATVMAVLILVIGVTQVGKGLGGLL
jgi:threonine/homoserine/homoserine lactone efflux protein